MLKVTLRSIGSNKIRFFLTTLTVVVGVTFVVAAFITADSLRSTFGDLSQDINQGYDVNLRAEVAFGDRDQSTPPIPGHVLDDVRALDSVDQAEPFFFVPPVVIIDALGEPVGGDFTPRAAINWTADETISQIYLIEGERPVGPDQFAVDVDVMADYDFSLGDRYAVTTSTGTTEFELTAVMQFGFPENAAVGATFAIFDSTTAQQVLGYGDQWQEIYVRATDGTDLDQLQTELQAILPDGVEAVTAEVVADEFADQFEAFIGPIQIVLLVFAFIVLFVSTFIINNTFNIILGQRIRELGLLRAIGATGRQVRQSVLTEALVVGVVATVVGLGLGVLGAIGIRELLQAGPGGGPPDGPLPIRLRTVIWAVSLGVGFTVLASLLPALKAARIPPIAALGSDVRLDSHDSRVRAGAGGTVAVLGIGLTTLALFGGLSTSLTLISLGIGAAVIFIALGILGPLFAGPSLALIGRPLPTLFGVPGSLARDNAVRSPRRSSATAIALTIGLALVVMVSVVASSLKTSIDDTLQEAFAGDFIVFDSSDGGMPREVSERLQTVVELDAVVPEKYDSVLFDGEETDLTGTAMDELLAVANLGRIVGSLSAGDPISRAAISVDWADDHDLTVGSEASIENRSGEQFDVEIVAVYEEDFVFGDQIIDLALMDILSSSQFDGDALLSLADGVTEEQGRAAIDGVLSDLPQIEVQTRDEAIARFKEFVDLILTIATVFLGVALVIALLGIVNTLTLSVFERTRELGLLRAVGMTARQVRRMIRWEAVVVAVFGALLGVVVGMVFGAAIVRAVPDDFIATITVPWRRIMGFIIVANIFGLLAAILPARRASRMKVLDAIAHA